MSAGDKFEATSSTSLMQLRTTLKQASLYLKDDNDTGACADAGEDLFSSFLPPASITTTKENNEKNAISNSNLNDTSQPSINTTTKKHHNALLFPREKCRLSTSHRLLCRQNKVPPSSPPFKSPHLSLHLLTVPRVLALDVLLFASHNPRIHILEAVEYGARNPKELVGGEADLRTDLPGYEVWRGGRRSREGVFDDVVMLWPTNGISFLLPSTLLVDRIFSLSSITTRSLDLNSPPPVYKTNLIARKSGPYMNCPVFVSMRPVRCSQVSRALAVLSSLPSSQRGREGITPIHVGNSGVDLGIEDLSSPANVSEGGKAVVLEGEVCLFFYEAYETLKNAVVTCGTAAGESVITSAGECGGFGGLFVSDAIVGEENVTIRNAKA